MAKRTDSKSMGLTRTLVALIVGALGAWLVWAATTYNNYLLRLSPISDSFLPVAALLVMLLLCGIINPLLRRFLPALVMDRRQLVLVFIILLTASVIPGQGLMKLLPYMLGEGPVEVSRDQTLSQLYEKIDLRPGVFPGRMEFGADATASSRFIDCLPEDESIPWGAWIGPLLNWGAFLLFFWMLMTGLAMIVYPQWRHRERLPFPLLQVFEAQLEEPDDGHCSPPLFHKRGFWIGVGLVCFIHLLHGLHQYFPNNVPAIPLRWDLSPAFEGTILSRLSWQLKTGRIYFVLLGVAYFMPTRISFSIWFFSLTYGLNEMVRTVYFPPYNWRGIQDQRTGAIFALTVITIWLGRKQWARVLRLAVRRAETEEDRRDQFAGRMFLLGMLGVFAWLVYMGVQPQWALFLIAVGFMVALVLSRVVAETGMPYMRLEGAYPFGLLKMLPVAWFSYATILFTGFMSVLFHTCARVHTTVMATHSLGLAEEKKSTDQRRVAILVVAVLVVGLVVAGAINLQLSYRWSAPLVGDPPINSAGVGHMTSTHGGIRSLADETFHAPRAYSQTGQIAFGATVATATQWACLQMPKWPLHPIGLLLVNTTYAGRALASVFLGWALQVLILRYGGSRGYRRAVPFFLGLIIGEILAAGFWVLVSAILAACGMPYERVDVQPS